MTALGKRSSQLLVCMMLCVPAPDASASIITRTLKRVIQADVRHHRERLIEDHQDWCRTEKGRLLVAAQQLRDRNAALKSDDIRVNELDNSDQKAPMANGIISLRLIEQRQSLAIERKGLTNELRERRIAIAAESAVLVHQESRFTAACASRPQQPNGMTHGVAYAK